MPVGRKTGGGSRKGIPNKATAKREKEVAASGLTPLEFMLQVLRDVGQTFEDRKWAAVSAAPFVHPRLTSAQFTGDLNIHDVSAEPEMTKDQWEQTFTPPKPQ